MAVASTGLLLVCLYCGVAGVWCSSVFGAMLGCAEDVACAVAGRAVDAFGFGVLGFTLNHVSPVHTVPASTLFCCLWLRSKYCSVKSSLLPSARLMIVLL